MADELISREAVLEQETFLCDEDGFERSCVLSSDIRYMLSVDAVEVVRCKDCTSGEVDDVNFPDQYYCHEGCGWNNAEFYCAYGERKEDNATD